MELGQKITFNATLYRANKSMPMKGLNHQCYREWLRDVDRFTIGKHIKKQYPKEGIIVGVRYLKKGMTCSTAGGSYDYESWFEQDGTTKAYLVSYDMRKNPVYVLPEDICKK